MDRVQFLSATMLLGLAHLTPAQSKTVPAPLQLVTGKQLFGKWCSDCHSTVMGPGSMAIQRQNQGAVPAILEQRGDLSAEYVKQVVRHGMLFMPSFRKTEISAAELARIADYLVKSGAGPKKAKSGARATEGKNR